MNSYSEYSEISNLIEIGVECVLTFYVIASMLGWLGRYAIKPGWGFVSLTTILSLFALGYGIFLIHDTRTASEIGFRQAQVRFAIGALQVLTL